MIPGFLQDAEVGLFWSRGADCDLAAFSSEVKVPISFCFFSSVCHSEEQDPVSNQRLHPDAEDGPDVALHEETQTTVGFLLSFLCSSLLLFFPYLCPSLSSHFHPFTVLFLIPQLLSLLLTKFTPLSLFFFISTSSLFSSSPSSSLCSHTPHAHLLLLMLSLRYRPLSHPRCCVSLGDGCSVMLQLCLLPPISRR